LDVENVQKHALVNPVVPDAIERRKAVLVAGDGLAIEDA
jgi:hypothetical protein